MVVIWTILTPSGMMKNEKEKIIAEIKKRIQNEAPELQRALEQAKECFGEFTISQLRFYK